ncbi:MAG TPA: aldehyde dehydrogenase family protein, partial [Firmicutes bacterium]|nr:aldehyde dehydrogenase family protein [Bacillota bacterium]
MAENLFYHVPEADFSKEEYRRKMHSALDKVRAQFARHYPLFIGGREVDTAEKIRSENPADFAQTVGTLAKADLAEAEQAVEAAARAYPDWNRRPAEERAAFLFKAAGVLERDRFEHAAWQVFEVGKVWREADADVCEAIDYLRYYGHEMIRLGHPRITEALPGEVNEYGYSPRGVALIIAPWNFPLAILLGMTSAAVVTGNCAIMKPSGQSSVIAAKLMEVFREADLPPGVLNFLPGPGGKIGRHLVSHPRVDLIAFTGSCKVGLGINQAAAEPHPELKG